MVARGTPVFTEIADSVSPDLTTYVRLRLVVDRFCEVGLVGVARCVVPVPLLLGSSLRLRSTTAYTATAQVTSATGASQRAGLRRRRYAMRCPEHRGGGGRQGAISSATRRARADARPRAWRRRPAHRRAARARRRSSARR